MGKNKAMGFLNLLFRGYETKNKNHHQKQNY
jgi:hypothetical protein